MDRFDGTLARQLDLTDDRDRPLLDRGRPQAQDRLRLLQKDVYTELARRRRSAQIKARHLIAED
jgi:hypothetical protein